MNSNLASFSLTSTVMLISRIFRRIGQTMILLGFLTLLFVVYQLWGTGLLTERYQQGLENDFEELVEQVEEVADEPEEVVSDSEVKPDLGEFLWRSEGEAMAQLTIPVLNLSKTVVSGVGVEALRKGPGHYSYTPLPGMPGNSAIAGHRTTWGAPFGDINKLEPGDEILIQTVQGSFTYRVVEQMGGRGHFIISPYRLDVLDQNFDTYPNRLTLISCHPKLTARQRIIVVAELVGEPADYYPPPKRAMFSLNLSFGIEGGDTSTPIDPSGTSDEQTPTTQAPPQDDPSPVEANPPSSETTSSQSNDLGESTEVTSFGEGLEGDKDAIAPTVAWGIAVFMIIITTLLVANRWRKWPAYFIGFFPFIAAVAVWFFNLEKALPS
ncbi:MAG: sortase [Actinomycetota bacterium]|nr:sortase [Actinomycetota bacterium]